MIPQQPRFVQITHADVMAAQRAEKDTEQGLEVDVEREHNRRARERTFAVVDAIAPAPKRYRYGIRVEERGNVSQTFACNCGKHSHGHGKPEHPDAFASIIEPTRFEVAPTQRVKKPDAAADLAIQRRADALAQRVRDSRVQRPTIDRKRR
ncbi:hypothetical protein HUN58_13780 [Curtobacterium sp. Csp1]|uniref:hypothetical protein n=1 Tax=Curtobacterium sp. Csp1 TaxID=2495429 RepID=UPI00159875C8|nr:hypothetical protein [Curtobacterium sp. Csp1]QKS20839.1 hypothetical protein HUN58_13780 [Curtobacterium sp. Csp1]